MLLTYQGHVYHVQQEDGDTLRLWDLRDGHVEYIKRFPLSCPTCWACHGPGEPCLAEPVDQIVKEEALCGSISLPTR